jgi:GxxExxY protein
VKDQPRTNAEERGLLEHRELTEQIIGIFYEVYNELGPGFLESVYAKAMAVALQQAGLTVEREKPIAVHFRNTLVGDFWADIVVNGQAICELKASPSIHRVYEAQLLNYLRASDIEVGLLLNFGPKPQSRRLAFSNARKRSALIRDDPRRDSVD